MGKIKIVKYCLLVLGLQTVGWMGQSVNIAYSETLLQGESFPFVSNSQLIILSRYHFVIELGKFAYIHYSFLFTQTIWRDDTQLIIIFSISYTIQNHTCFAIFNIVTSKDKSCFYTKSTDFKDCCKIIPIAEYNCDSAFQNAISLNHFLKHKKI